MKAFTIKAWTWFWVGAVSVGFWCGVGWLFIKVFG